MRTEAPKAWTILLFASITLVLAFACRLLEWPEWQNPEFRYGKEMLLATHDAYHWVAGATGFGAAVDHPMAILLRITAKICHVHPANAAFWIPPIMASLVAMLVFFWAWILGGKQTAIAAGLIASISPGFLGRTLLGFYDTDLVTIFFPLLITLLPALWCKLFLLSPAALLATRQQKSTAEPQSQAQYIALPNSPFWLLLLASFGLLANWTQEWHSLFPYLVRYNVLLLLLLVLLFGPKKQKRNMLWTALAYAVPTASGLWGMLFLIPAMAAAKLQKLRSICIGSPVLLIFWLATLACLAQGAIFDTLLYQINAYLKHSGDAHSSGSTSLIFPSVAQSIIEVQDLSIAALFSYFHPWLEAAIIGFLGFCLVICRQPIALFLLPLAALGILSSRLGGRMVMFGAPITALGLALPIFWLAQYLLKNKLTTPNIARITCTALIIIFVAPFLDMIPALSQGPVLNRRHAAALTQAGAITPPDAMLWLWWDWGYAAHYFAKRDTVADGARHGGPSLYLPAAVFATDNARFARQIIRYTSTKENEPGNFFKNMTPDAAQELINKLRSQNTPLVIGQGKQYLIISFEMLKLGFWISNFGSWNFITHSGESGALSIVPEAVAYKLNAGEVRLAGSTGIIFPTSINIFAETGVTKRNYVQEWFKEHPNATAEQQKAWLASRRNINFLFNKVTDEKLAVDQGIYNSLMVQLLLCNAHDPRFAPYFRLVYDNVFTRIYEVI